MRRGFTLVEVVVMLAILGLTAAAVAPALGRLGTEPTGSAAREFAGDLRSARRTAIERGRAATVSTVPGTGRYTVERDARDGDGPPEVDVRDLPDDARFAASEPPARIRFSPLGVATAGRVSIRAAGRRTVVSVDRWTGGVRVERR